MKTYKNVKLMVLNLKEEDVIRTSIIDPMEDEGVFVSDGWAES